MGSLAAPLFTAALSHKQHPHWPAQCRPHSTTATTMGTSSLGAMVTEWQVLGH